MSIANAPRPRRTSLFAHGEPAVWLTGGALAVSLFMILGFLLLVLVNGMSTFWPAEILRVETIDGRIFLGEVTREETWIPEGRGESVRRLLRTENFKLTGVHANWVADFEVAKETRPEWAVLIERSKGGRFYGYPAAFRIDGEVVATEPAAVWEKFEELHDEIRERFRRRYDLQKYDIGEVNARMAEAELALRRVELGDGKDSEEYATARAETLAALAIGREQNRKITEEIEALNRENARFVMQVRTGDGMETDVQLDRIVRAFPANQLGLLDQVGVYISRWWEFLSDDPREANSEGGVFPAIFGTVLMTLIMTILVVPFGVLGALYIREYAKAGPLISAVRIAINNLAGVPSIVYGVFGLGFFCYIVGANIDEIFYPEFAPNPKFGKGALIWASLTLALLTLPVVIVATEEALAAVPGSMREGSYACGASKWQTIRRIVLPRAMPGIMTGMILAMARGAGEVAPLMLVGAVKLAPELPIDSAFPFGADRSFMHLGFHIFDLAFQSPNAAAAKPMVFTSTLLLIGLIVLLNIAAIWIRGRLRKKFGEGQF